MRLSAAGAIDSSRICSTWSRQLYRFASSVWEHVSYPLKQLLISIASGRGLAGDKLNKLANGGERDIITISDTYAVVIKFTRAVFSHCLYKRRPYA